MLNFPKNDTESDVSTTLFRIKGLSARIEQKITQKGSSKDDKFVETLSVEELKDLGQVILASEYLLTKYQDKKDLKSFLEEFIGIIMHAANSVNVLRDELEDLVISAEVALQQIQTLHDDVTQNLTLGRGLQTKLDDFRIPLIKTEAKAQYVQIEEAKQETSPINLTNSTRRVHTNDYLTKTPVEI
jgi:archaellum component FlaC